MAIVRFCVAFFNHNIARSGSVASVGSLVRISHTVAGGARGAIAHPVNITDQGIPAMARETIYLVQAFKPGKGARLNADAVIRCKSSDGARRTAEGLAPTRAGVVAFSTSGDAELGEYDDEPTIIFKTGRLPAPFAEV